MAVTYLEPIPILEGSTAKEFIKKAEKVKPSKLSKQEKLLISEIKKFSKEK